MAPPFDLSWTPELENKLSTQIDGQLPDFIAEDHPLFSQFLKSYYQYLESGELQLTVLIDNIILDVDTPTNLLNEDGTLIVTEVGSGTTGKFIEGETITGNITGATATVLVEDLGNATPRLFISSQQLFETGETVTGGTSTSSGVVTRYRANPVQNIQQLLAYADIDNTIFDFIEEFRKSFMSGIPSNLANGINKRNLEKHIGELYRRKGTKEGAKLFMKILLDEESEVFYPNQYMMKASDADWDKPTFIRCSATGDVVADELIGQSITGASSLATALVESSTTFSVTGGTSYIQFEISSLLGTFINGETIYGISSKGDIRYNFVISQILSTVSTSNAGTLYKSGDLLDLDTSPGIGSGDISAVVGIVERGSVSDIVIDDGGTKYEIGDLAVFTNNSAEAGVVESAEGVVTVINGNILNETGDTVIQESGTNSYIELFNFQLEDATFAGEAPYAVFGTDRLYSSTIGYYYPLHLTKFAAEQDTVIKSSASTNGETFNSTSVKLDNATGNDIILGMVVRSNSISEGARVTVTSVTDQSTISLSIPQTFLDNEVLVFESDVTKVRTYEFLEYPGLIFYSPTATTVSGSSSYDADTYDLWGGNYNHRSDHLYGESGNVATYVGGINTELVLGDRFESEWSVNINIADTHRYDNEGIMLEDGSGDITKISLLKPGSGYLSLPTITVRSQYGTGINALAIPKDIGRISSIDIINSGFNYTEVPKLDHRAKFVLKNITGNFVVGEALTSGNTGTVRSYDSVAQILEVSLTDAFGIQDESQGGTSNEGVLLEDSVANREYVNDSIILDANLVHEENLVDENGDRLLLDAIIATTGFILLEDDQGELIMEHPDVEELAQTVLEDGSGSLRSEPPIKDSRDQVMGEFICQESGFRTDVAPVYVYDRRQVKFILEDSTVPVMSVGGGTFIILDADLDNGENLVLNGTDSNSLNAGEKIIPNATDANGTNDPSNLIVLDLDDAGDENSKLLHETDDPFDAVILNGTDDNSLHATDKLLLNGAGVDFSTGTETISTATGSGTIAHVDIAKSDFVLGTTTEKTGTFDGIENLISEELIKIQDSYYYQDFSYEIQTSSGSDLYINELKKAVHPAGFNVFAKVITVSFVSMRAKLGEAQDVGASDLDSDLFNALLGGTFFSVFSDPIQRRLGFTTTEETGLLLESSIQQGDGDQFILETETGIGFVGLEPPENAYPDFEAIEISYGSGSGEFGVLLTEDLNRIVSESAENITNNLVIDGTEPDHLSTSQDDAGSDLVMEDGLLFELEDSLQDGTSFMLGEDTSIFEHLISEQLAETFVIEGVSDYDRDIHVRSIITTKLNATLNKTHNTANGLLFLSTTSIEGITGDGIMLEVGSAQIGSRLLITQTDASGADLADHFLLEDAIDFNINQSVTKETLGGSYSYNDEDFTRDTLLNISDINSLDTIVLEGDEIGTFKQEDGTTVTGTFGDDIILEDYTGLGVGVKLSLERMFISLEESLNVGEKPFGIEENTTLEPFTFPADIFVNTNGKLAHEDTDNLLIDHSGNSELIIESGGNILLEASLDDTGNISGHITLEGDDESTGFEFLLEDGTDLDLYIRAVASGITIETGFSGTTVTFDNVVESFDLERV